jgi:signal transduction histidine kinase
MENPVATVPARRLARSGGRSSPPEPIGGAISLEKKFVLALLALLVPSCALYAMWERRRGNKIVVALQPGAAAAVGDLLTTNVLVTLSLAIVVAMIALVMGHFMVLKPLRQLVVMARAVGDGDFARRLHLQRDDDIGRLADEMDATSDKLEAAQRAAEAHVAALEQLRHSDRVTTLGRLASSVAHELGNPINVIELRAQMIATGATSSTADARQSATIIVEQTQRMTRIISEVLSFASRRPRKKENVDVVDVVRSAVALCAQTAKQRNVSVRLDVPGTAVDIQGDRDRLLQVVLNLVINGVQAMSGGVLTVSVHDERRAPEGNPRGSEEPYACIDVIDHGVGIPTESLPRIFEPFFSTKSAEEGTGLGLSIAQGIAKEHDGWISVASEPGHGASFSVHLPKANGVAHGE